MPLDLGHQLETAQPLDEQAGDPGGVELGVDRDERPALVVELAQHQGAQRHAVQLVLDVELDERTLVLQDEDLRQPVGELPHDASLERVGHPQLQQPHAEAVQLVVVQPEVPAGLAQVEVRLARRDDAEAVVRPVQGDPVDVVLARVGERGRHTGVDERAFQLQDAGAVEVGGRDVHVGTTVELRRHHDRRHPTWGDEGRAGAVGDARRHLECGPQARAARERHRVHAEVEDLLYVAGVEHRHHDGGRWELGGARCGGRLGGGVVPDDGHRAARPGSCRTGWPVASRPSRGRSRWPCRTRCRRPRRTSVLAAARPAGCP